MPLLFLPEPLKVLQARFQDALTPIYDAEQLIAAVATKDPQRPTLQRRHVFDFESGMRVAVTAETDIDADFLVRDRTYVHLSGSIYDDKGSVLFREIRAFAASSYAKTRDLREANSQLFDYIAAKFDAAFFALTSQPRPHVWVGWSSSLTVYHAFQEFHRDGQEASGAGCVTAVGAG